MKRLLAALLLFVACDKEELLEKNQESTPDYIVFGHFYGECLGEGCIEIYKLTDANLLEDSKDQYPGNENSYSGEFSITLGQNLFSEVVDLKNKIPTELSEIPNGVIGSPDAGDWGGIYFEYRKNGVTKYWLIDKMKSNVPTSITPLIDEIEKDIALINQ